MSNFARHPICPTHKRPLEISRGSLACASCATAKGKSERVWRACERKHVYPRRQAAEQAAREWGHTVYRCRACNKWHITSREKAAS